MGISSETIPPVLVIESKHSNVQSSQLIKDYVYNLTLKKALYEANELRKSHLQQAYPKVLDFKYYAYPTEREDEQGNLFSVYTLYLFSLFCEPKDAKVNEGIIPDAFGDVGDSQSISIQVFNSIDSIDYDVRNFKKCHIVNQFYWIRTS